MHVPAMERQQYLMTSGSYHKLGKVCLTIEDKSAIEDAKRLNDKHITFAQNVLKVQFPEIETILQERFTFASCKHIV